MTRGALLFGGATTVANSHSVNQIVLQWRATSLPNPMAAHEGVMVARLGGEEFAVLLADKRTPEALQVGTAVCATVRQANLEHRFAQTPSHVTVRHRRGLHLACMPV